MPGSVIKAALDAVPDPMLYIDRDGQIAETNAPATALLGNWIAGRNYMTALRQPALLAQVEAALQGRDRAEARFVQTDHSGEIMYRVTSRRLNEESDHMAGVVLHFADISHLHEAAEMRRDFVANVSHELRTPLTAVLGFIETLRGPARNDAGVRDRFLAIMEDEARRMNRLVSDLLSLSRVESEARVRPSQRVEMMGILESVAVSLRSRAEDRGSRIEIAASGGDHTVTGDHDQLTQVMLNLVENALKYGTDGTAVTLRLGTAEGRGGLRGPAVRVDVIDRGEGIDPLHLPRLTERFYRIDAHRSRAMGGTGLGLAIVKHIVNRHRGRLRITSEKGVGSTFSVLLPRD